MGIFTPSRIYKPATGETGWGAQVNDNFERLGELVFNVKAFGAVVDGATDDTAAVLAARDAAGVGGTVLVPGIALMSQPLIPLGSQVWRGIGNMRYDGSLGTAIRYNGTAEAILLENVNNVAFEHMQIQCTDLSGDGIRITNSSYNHFRNVTFNGPGTTGGVGLLMHGEGTCQCTNSFESVHWEGWGTGIHLSGDSNANYFASSQLQSCATGIKLALFGADTFAGSDNEFNRFELNGSTTTGIVLDNAANRNTFIKVVMDGVTTTGMTVASGCTRNLFVHCNIGPTWSDLETAFPNFYAWCTNPAALIDKLKMGGGVLEFGSDVNLYKGGTNVLKTDDSFYGVLDIIARQNDTAKQVRIGNGTTSGVRFGSAEDTILYRAAADHLKTDDRFTAVGGIDTRVVATASLPAAEASMDGHVLIEDAGAGDRNLILYAGGQRFRLDGGAAF